MGTLMSAHTAKSKRRKRPTRPAPRASGLSARMPRIDHDSEIRVLRGLWQEQRTLMAARGHAGANADYLDAHFAMDLSLRRHLAVVDWMMPWIRGRVLEWGCQHALDSCLYRLRYGDAVDLHGCDVVDPEAYMPFHRFSGLKYIPLGHPFLLPFDDECFDVVTSNGVLEHVPEDAESVGEIYRVLKPDGMFLIACLPNRASYTEAIQRWMGNTAHDRLYTIKSTQTMLGRAGFEVLDHAYYFLLPTMLNGYSRRTKALYQQAHGFVRSANWVLERLWPINRLASNLMLLARKR
jgi:SAM-dependent methyltransferase